MKPEQRLWARQLQPALKAIVGMEYDRIENKTGVAGIPDVCYSFGGAGWIELKDAGSKTLWPSSIDLSGWEPEQRTWAKRHRKAGAKVFLMVRTSELITIIDPLACYDLEWVDLTDRAVLHTFESLASPDNRRTLGRILKVGP